MTRPFRFGVQLYGAETREQWLEINRKAEAQGYSVVTMPDHFEERAGFCRSLGAAIPEVKIGMGEFRGLDGGSEWEYFEPIRPGDRISVVSKIADIRESAGRLGAMVFITVETSYTNHYNQLCALQRSTVIRY